VTILNVALAKDRALIATNTEGVRMVDLVKTRCSKLFPLPHANAVVAGRGQLATIFNVYSDALAQMSDFDCIAKAMQSIVKRRHADLVAEFKRAAIGVDTDVQILLVGWSEARGQMAGYLYTPNATHDLLERGGFLSPWEGKWGAAPALDLDPDGMQTLVEQQSTHAEAGDHPGMAWGGDVLLAEVAREYVMTSVRPMRLSTVNSSS
jgi:hypothetical protein